MSAEDSDEDASGTERSAQRAAAEQQIRNLHDAGDTDAATTTAIEVYGAEIFGFLQALARDEDLAAEAFSVFAEDLWKGLPRFRWESSLRTWAYALARNALHRVRRDPARRPGRHIALSQAGAISGVAAVVRSVTSPHLRSEVKDAFATLRERLDPDDHALLILRIDRRMSWREIASAMTPDVDDNRELDRRAATLRKRFERAKAELRDLATKSGLLRSE